MRACHFLSLGVAVAAAVGLSAQAGQYAQIGDVQIGGAAGWDYLNVDSAAKRVYVSHGAEVVVIDTTNNTVAGKIGDLKGVHGIALAADLGKGFISNGQGNNITVFNLKTLAVTGTVAVGNNPDAILYEPKMKQVYAFNKRDNTASVIDAAKDTVVATIPLGGSPETGQADPALGRVFVNLEDKNQIQTIDIATHKTVDTWSIAPVDGPTGLAIDLQTHRLFAGGSYTAMVDAKTGKVIDSMKICQGSDATWYDPGTKYVFSSCGDGTTTIMKVAGDKLTLVQTLQTANRARTMTVDPATHRLYLSSVQPAQGGGRGAAPNTFHLVGVGLK
jgi:YVTN family beta-propeller protein